MIGWMSKMFCVLGSDVVAPWQMPGGLTFCVATLLGLLAVSGTVSLTDYARGYPHPLRHRAGQSVRRGATVATGLRRTAEAGGGEAFSGETGTNPPGDRLGPRGLRAAGGCG